MHWEKKICIRITLRRIVGTILAASVVANLIIVGAVYGADSAPPAPTRTSESTTPLPTSSFRIPGATVEGTAILAWTPLPGVTLTDTPGVTLTNTFTPAQMSGDLPGWPLCIKRFYWRTYRVRQGDTLFALASATGSTVNELTAANCLANGQIYAGQVLYVPRLLISTITSTLPATPTPSITATPSATETTLPTATYTSTSTDTPTITPTYTPSQTATDTPTSTFTSTATNTPPSPTIAPNSPPGVEILSPGDKSQLPYGNFDRKLNLWFTDVLLEGRAADPEDDMLSGPSLVWSTDFSNANVGSALGEGNLVKAILYSDSCSGIWHTITLTATDSRGEKSSTVINVFVGEGARC
jgi:hypothetical protein